MPAITTPLWASPQAASSSTSAPASSSSTSDSSTSMQLPILPPHSATDSTDNSAPSSDSASAGFQLRQPQSQQNQQQQQQISNQLPLAPAAPAVSPFLSAVSHEQQIHNNDKYDNFLQQNLQQHQQQQQTYELFHQQHLQLPSLEAIGASVLEHPQLPSALAILAVLFVGRKLAKFLRQPARSSSSSSSSLPFPPQNNNSRSPIKKSPSQSPISTQRSLHSVSEAQIFNHQTFLHGFHKFSDSKAAVRPPPLTPPEISPSVFTLEPQCSREPEFHHQTNSDYLSDTDADEFFVANNIKMSDPSGGQSNTGSSSSGSASSSGAPQGQTISGQGSQGGTWTRHTVVYGNGPCPCCEGRTGGTYGPNVSPAEKR